MAEIKDYIWAVPIIGGIFGIITFLAPVLYWDFNTYYPLDWYYWIWGFVSYRMTYNDSPDAYFTGFTTNDTLLMVSIIVTLIISIGTVLLFSGGIISKRNPGFNRNFEKITAVGAFLLLVGAITWLIGADWPYLDQLWNILDKRLGAIQHETFEEYYLWSYFGVGFGIISPIIGGVISLIGIPMHNYYFKNITERVAQRKEVIEKKAIITGKSALMSLCSECGYKIELKDPKFCPNCGFKL